MPRKCATTPRRDKLEFVFRVILGNAIWRLPSRTVLAWFSKHPQGSGSPWRCGHCSGRACSRQRHDRNRQLVLWYWVVPLEVIPARGQLDTTGHWKPCGPDRRRGPDVQIRGWTSHAWTRHFFGGHMDDDMYHPICTTGARYADTVLWMLPAALKIRERCPRANGAPWCSGFFFEAPQHPRRALRPR